MDNVISLDDYRARVFPSNEEIVEYLSVVADEADTHEEFEVARYLLAMHLDDKLLVTRNKSGDFLWSLKDDHD